MDRGRHRKADGRRGWDATAGPLVAPRLETVCLLAPDGCPECMVEAGRPHRRADCTGNTAQLARLNGGL